MKCRACGLEIAEKAIVCYRCGTPTAEPPMTVAPRRRRPAWIAVPLVLIIVALGVWLIPRTPAASIDRWAAWVGLVMMALASVLWLRRRSSR